MFRKLYDRCTDRKVLTSSRIRPVFAYDKNASELVEVGKKDVIAECNAFYEVSLISNKLQRFRNGDIMALSARKGVYADISGMPTDYNSLCNMVDSAIKTAKDNGFDSIPEYLQSLIKLDSDKAYSDKADIDKADIDKPETVRGDSNE